MGRPRGSGQRGRWEGGSGWGIHVNPWLIHVSVWQDPLQYCEIISLQLIKINEKILKKEIMWWLLWRKLHVLLHLSPVPTTRLGTLLPGHHNIAQTELVCWGIAGKHGRVENRSCISGCVTAFVLASCWTRVHRTVWPDTHFHCIASRGSDTVDGRECNFHSLPLLVATTPCTKRPWELSLATPQGRYTTETTTAHLCLYLLKVKQEILHTYVPL